MDLRFFQFFGFYGLFIFLFETKGIDHNQPTISLICLYNLNLIEVELKCENILS